MVLYTILAYNSMRLAMKSKRILIVRYNYAINFAREYLPSIALKVRMMNLHFVAIIFYCILYLTMLILTKVVFSQIFINQNFLVVQEWVDFIGLSFFL
jgi:hypothetical protein